MVVLIIWLHYFNFANSGTPDFDFFRLPFLNELDFDFMGTLESANFDYQFVAASLLFADIAYSNLI